MPLHSMVSGKSLSGQRNYSNPFGKGLVTQSGTITILRKREKCHGKSQGIACEVICIKPFVSEGEDVPGSYSGLGGGRGHGRTHHSC